ncbi:hypothetical protein BN946_scf184983.g19, partial [Trametes cinnabarina]
MASVADDPNSRSTLSDNASPTLAASGAPAHVRVSRRLDDSLPPTLPPLELPGEIIFPALHSAPEMQTRSTMHVPLFNEPLQREPLRQADEQPARSVEADGLLSMITQLLGFVGPNAKARRELLTLIFNLLFGFVQLVIIVTLLAYSARHESPTMPGKTEWQAIEAARVPPRQSNRATGLSYEGTSNANTDSSSGVAQSRFHARVSLCMSFISLAWFLTAHVLAYTSVNTCRFAAPHLWWLTFGILCILYLMILEIFLLGLLVFVLGPVLYLVWNIVLLCLGRHPLQNPHYIKPEIGKLPKSIVEQIPLVLYIPPPPEASADDGLAVTVPQEVHAYPPKNSNSTSLSSVPKRRFAFFRRKGASKNKLRSFGQADGSSEKQVAGLGKHAGGAGGPGDDDVDVPWDEIWEKGEYPFVRLEGNRAVCAICLMDFEAPKRVRGPRAADKAGAVASAGAEKRAEVAVTSAVQEIQVEEVTEEERDALRLDDAGEGAQPLRLLSCGHAFHQPCVDPWLTNVSGRCPTCQRPVELEKPSKKKKRPQRT